MIKQQKPIGILGGTFDPIHFGHLRVALEVLYDCNLQEIRFIPCRQPLLKQGAIANADDRLAMLSLAIANQAGFIIDTREINRDTPSYMVITLESLRSEFQTQSLCLIMGLDVFTNLPKWHEWQRILSLSHIIVVQRPQYTMPTSKEMANLIEKHETKDLTSLHRETHGKIFFAESTFLNISATEIRKMTSNERSPRFLTPDSVVAYMNKKKLYRPPNPSDNSKQRSN